MKHLTKKVVSQNYKLADPINKALFKQFQRITKSDSLGLVSRILETDEFVAVVNEANECVSVITHLDLLSFASKNGKAANGIEKAVLNGNGVHKESNGHSNGFANGHSNGHSNGNVNGHLNEHLNGHSNGVNGSENGHTNGH